MNALSGSRKGPDRSRDAHVAGPVRASGASRDAPGAGVRIWCGRVAGPDRALQRNNDDASLSSSP
jgi:hypothetical protein